MTQAQAIEKKVNKSAIARTILKEIGALTKSPPEGWRKTVEHRLHEQNLSMSVTAIYQVRQKEMNKKSRIKAAKVDKTSLPSKSKKNSNEFSLLFKVASLAKEVGGISKLEKMVAALKDLKSHC